MVVVSQARQSICRFSGNTNNKRVKRWSSCLKLQAYLFTLRCSGDELTGNAHMTFRHTIFPEDEQAARVRRRHNAEGSLQQAELRLAEASNLPVEPRHHRNRSEDKVTEVQVELAEAQAADSACLATRQSPAASAEGWQRRWSQHWPRPPASSGGGTGGGGAGTRGRLGLMPMVLTHTLALSSWALTQPWIILSWSRTWPPPGFSAAASA